MYRTHIYITLSTDTPAVTDRKWAYLMTIEGHEKTASCSGNIRGSRHAATLTALASALDRYRQPAQITVHAEDAWVLHTMLDALEKWASGGWKTAKGEEIKDRALWEHVWNKTRYKKMLIKTECHAHTDALKEAMQ